MKKVIFNHIKLQQLIIVKAAKQRVRANVIRVKIKKGLGITKQVLSNWERGRNAPRKPEELLFLRNFFALKNIDSLFVEVD